jgi:putative SOS response-associated peptidase YedK
MRYETSCLACGSGKALTKPKEWDTWLQGMVNEAITLQRRLPNELLRIVARGEKSNHAPSEAYQ